MATAYAVNGMNTQAQPTLLAMPNGIVTPANVDVKVSLSAQGQSKQDALVQPKELTPFQRKVVDMVNPKFTNFSDPYKLATSIACATFVIFMLCLVLCMTVCPTVSNGLTIASSEEHKMKVVSGQVACVYSVLYLTVVPAHGTITGAMIQVGCNVPESELENWGTGYCPGHTPAENAAKWGPSYNVGCPGGHGGFLYGAYYEERECPNFGTAFGSALAYTVYIEFAFTLFFIWWYTKTGAIKPLNKDATLFGTASAGMENSAKLTKIENDVAQLKQSVGGTSGPAALAESPKQVPQQTVAPVMYPQQVQPQQIVAPLVYPQPVQTAHQQVTPQTSDDGELL